MWVGGGEEANNEGGDVDLGGEAEGGAVGAVVEEEAEVKVESGWGIRWH